MIVTKNKELLVFYLEKIRISCYTKKYEICTNFHFFSSKI